MSFSKRSSMRRITINNHVYNNAVFMKEDDIGTKMSNSVHEDEQMTRFMSALKMLNTLKQEKDRMANDPDFQEEKTETIWFSTSKIAAVFSIFCIISCLVVNCVLFFYHYNHNIRIYQFILCIPLMASCILICYYWSQPRGPKIEDDTINYISWPMIAMTLLMAAASVIGYLDFIYFTTIFKECDKAIETSIPWQIASDMCFYVAFLFAFSLYPLFIFRCYFMPIFAKWRWILHMVAVNIMIVFIHLTLKEAYHSYIHLCENSHAKVEPCVTIVEHHHFHCNNSQLTDIQRLWLEMHSQMGQPGIFLVVAEYLPLLFVMLLMVPVAKNSSAIHQLMAALYRTRTWTLTAPEKFQLLHAEDFHRRAPIWPARITFLGSVLLFVSMFFRFGVLLNCLGRYPSMNYVFEGVAQAIVFTTMTALFIHCNWIWLGNMREPKHEKDDEKMLHHLVHARLDSMLLRIAFFLCILQISVASLVDMRLYEHKYISVLVKIPIIFAYLMQYMLLTKAMKLEEFHWKRVNKVAACVLTVAALTTNIIEWNAQFLKRRFTVFFLKTGPTITQAHIAGAAVSEMLYPALSFYHFHAALCWLTVLWRVLKCFKKKSKDKEGVNHQGSYRLTVIRF